MVGDELPRWYDEVEERSRQYARRGVYLVRNVRPGEEMKAEDVVFLRPQGEGVSPLEWNKKLGRKEKYKEAIKKGHQLLPWM